MSVARVSKFLTVAMATVLLSACGLGDGSRPVSMEIRRATSSLLGSTSNKAFVCFADQLQVIATDTDGRLGDFTQRVIWTSSNTAVARISNGDIQIPGDSTQAYASGVVLPQAPGTTIITARFSKLEASYELTVAEPTAISIEPTEQSLARYSSAPIRLRAVVDGYNRDVTALASWSIIEAATDENSDDIAVIGASSGIVAAGDTLGTRTAKAQLLACPDASPVTTMAANLVSTIRVRALTALSVSREFGTAQPLTVGTTEKFTITGHFDGTDQTQDLSGQARFENVDETGAVDTEGSAVAGGTSPANFVLAASAGSTLLRPRFPPTDRDDFATITGPVQPITTLERTFVSFAVTPTTATVEPFGSQQFTATATYADGATQDITRHVTWTYPQDVIRDVLTDVIARVTIGNVYSNAGLVTANQLADSESTIRVVRGTGDDAVEQAVTFIVNAP